MTEARRPLDEQNRLERLHRLGILDTPGDRRFDAVTARALSLFPGAEVAAVSLIDADRQWFKSILGLDASEIPRCVSFCAHAILGNRVMVVEDATRDKRFADNPSVTGPPGIRFYAGAPLLDGLGSLCVIGTAPRRVSMMEIATLAHLACHAETHLLAHGALHALRRG